jgi:hypothetical protein
MVAYTEHRAVGAVATKPPRTPRTLPTSGIDLADDPQSATRPMNSWPMTPLNPLYPRVISKSVPQIPAFSTWTLVQPSGNAGSECAVVKCNCSLKIRARIITSRFNLH